MDKRNLAAISVLTLVGFWLRVPHFTSLALIGSDGSEYVHSVQNHYFPHSPYIVYFWAGWLIDKFVELDWGYSALSMASSLATIGLAASVAEKLSGSKVGGWVAGGVFAIVPVGIRFAGLQEVYAFQLLWIVLAWRWAVGRRSWFGCGIFFGLAMATHSGSVFALPATLLLLLFEARTPEGGWKIEEGEWKAPLLFLTGLAVPLAIAGGWLLFIWISAHGWEKLPLLTYFLRGAAPSPHLDLLYGAGSTSYWAEQLARTWRDVSNGEVTGTVLLVAGALGLTLSPPKKSLPWWALTLPYLFYEIAMGYSLDPGIFLVFVVPSLSIGLGLAAAKLISRPRSIAGILSGVCVASGIVGGIVNLAAYQATADYRNDLPWMRPESSTLALCDFVRENTPADTLLIQPVDWDPTGLATTLYSDRTVLFNDGEVGLFAPWKPMFTHPIFNHARPITTEDFEKWIDEERPFVCFDNEPFRSYGCYWPKVDIDRYETRPILWLDRNQSGTERLWNQENVLATIDIGNPTDERTYHVNYPAGHGKGEIEMWLYRPTLYRIARKTDPPDTPAWVAELRERVPERQRGAVPAVKEDGISFPAGEGEVRFESPTRPGLDHVVHLRLNSVASDYWIECQVRTGGRWVLADRDMEKIVVVPDARFADLYFEVPAKRISEETTEFRLLPKGDTRFMNAFRIEVATLGGPYGVVQESSDGVR